MQKYMLNFPGYLAIIKLLLFFSVLFSDQKLFFELFETNVIKVEARYDKVRDMKINSLEKRSLKGVD